MKRMKETEFLRLEIMINICDNCRRWNGEFTENDSYVCKYNTNNKGLFCGLTENFKQNYKCKYFKRNVAIITSDFRSKNYSTVYKDEVFKYKKEIKWIKGKYKIKNFRFLRDLIELGECYNFMVEQEKEQVYCTNCVHFKLSDEEIPYCINEDKCDITNCEDSAPIEDRPFYEQIDTNN